MPKIRFSDRSFERYEKGREPELISRKGRKRDPDARPPFHSRLPEVHVNIRSSYPFTANLKVKFGAMAKKLDKVNPNIKLILFDRLKFMLGRFGNEGAEKFLEIMDNENLLALLNETRTYPHHSFVIFLFIMEIAYTRMIDIKEEIKVGIKGEVEAEPDISCLGRPSNKNRKFDVDETNEVLDIIIGQISLLYRKGPSEDRLKTKLLEKMLNGALKVFLDTICEEYNQARLIELVRLARSPKSSIPPDLTEDRKKVQVRGIKDAERARTKRGKSDLSAKYSKLAQVKEKLDKTSLNLGCILEGSGTTFFRLCEKFRERGKEGFLEVLDQKEIYALLENINSRYGVCLTVTIAGIIAELIAASLPDIRSQVFEHPDRVKLDVKKSKQTVLDAVCVLDQFKDSGFEKVLLEGQKLLKAYSIQVCDTNFLFREWIIGHQERSGIN